MCLHPYPLIFNYFRVNVDCYYTERILGTYCLITGLNEPSFLVHWKYARLIGRY